MKKCILLPLHLYDYDVQGDSYMDEKISMYRFSIEQTLKASKGIHVIVICHGKKRKIFKKIPKNLEVYWSKYYKEPNINGLFDGNPAQRSVVYEGLNLAKKKGYEYVIKGRADSAILNIQPILNLSLKNNDKYIFTQITSFTEPWLLGDCFMAAKIDKLIQLWSPSNHYDSDGLKYFAWKIMEIEGGNDLFQLILSKAFYVDLTKLQIVDFRFTWSRKDSWLKNNEYNWKEIMWGKTNNWLRANNNNITEGDRPNIITQKMVKKTTMDRYKLVRKIKVLYRRFYRLLTGSDLYKL